MSLPPFYPPWKHDVFVSFKGGDVIETFVSHLFERLKQVGIGHFGDNKREDAGENIERKCLVAFEEARFALVVFSTNYVDCSRCLSWLVKILDCKRDSKLVVVPIFYEDRAKVLNFARDGKFERALENVETKEKYAEKKKWGRALEEAGKIRGYYELKPYNSERNLIDKIVGRLINKIHSRYPGKDFVFGPFGGEDRNNQKPFKIEKIDGRGNDGKEKENDGKGIHVKYGDFIKSVTFEVPEGTRTEPQNDGMSLFMVKLKEGEYITSFAGSKNANEEGILINSLTFRTNRRILGPIGREKEEEKEEKKEEKEEEDKMKKKDKKQKKKEEEETQKKKEEEEEEKKKKQKEEEKKKEEAYFSVPLDAGKVTEFFWRKKGDFLESVGASVQLHPEGFNPFLSVGLFGREDGKEWNDERTHANVNKITVWIDQKEEEKPDSSNAQKKKKKALAKNEELDPSGGPFIRLIEFTYEENNGILGEPKKHGSETGLDMKKKPHIIQLDADEYLTSISGYYTDVISRRYRDFGITSLTFRTNKQMAITIGEEKGIYFSSPATAGKIVGFYGWSDQHLCGIGAHFEPISDLLPFGGGSVMDGVREICPFLKPDGCIHRIELVYDNRRGEDCTFTYGPTEGVSNAIEPKKLDYPREYLTSISGYVGEDDGAIKSLTFYSNKQRFLIGKEEKGKYYFWYPSAGSRIIGLCGSGAPTYIGVHVEPIPHLYPFKTVGPPMKGFGGDPWDDGVYTNVRGYRVTTSRDNNKNKIESITFMYDNNGSLVEGDRHGGGEASTGEWEMLDFPKVRLLRIQGHMREEDGETIIHNLTMVPTKGPSVPYAPREDKTSSTHFVIPEKAEDGRIVGLFGMAKRHLNSIGVRLEPY